MRAFCLCLTIGVLVSTSAQAAEKTTIVVFQPWASGTLSSGFKASQRAKGTCYTHSLSTDRPDAWRCFVGDDILDPCFAPSAHSETVACAKSPFSKSVVLLSLQEPLARDDNPTTKWLQPKGMPWGLRLSDGGTCVFVTGATDVVAGDRLNYACTTTGWIIGAPDRSRAQWTARSVPWPNKRITRVSIATAIF